MKINHLVLCAGLAVGLAAITPVVHAQTDTQRTRDNDRNDPNRNDPGQRTVVGEGTPSQALPPPRSDNDPLPPVAAPTVPESGYIRQAGVGGTTGYARAGVVELGGSLGINLGGNLRQVTVAPSIGWFFADNLQLSAIVAVNYASTVTNSVRTSSSSFSVLAEPSYHLPLSRSLFAFAGVGVGVAYAEGPGAGFALAPRLGVNVLVGRSGIFTPALQFLYSTSDVIQTPQGTLIAGSTSFGLNAGYTVMW